MRERAKKTRTGFYYQMSLNTDSSTSARCALQIQRSWQVMNVCPMIFVDMNYLWAQCDYTGSSKLFSKLQKHESHSLFIFIWNHSHYCFFFLLNLARKVSRRCSKFHTKCCNVSHCIASCVTHKTPINWRAKKSLQAQVWLHYFPLYSSLVWFHFLILFTAENGIIWCFIIFKHVTFFSSLVSEVQGTDNIIGDRAKVHFPSLQKYPG